MISFFRHSAGSKRTRPLLRKAPMASALIVALMCAVALLSNWIMPHDPYEAVLRHKLMPPSWQPGGDLSYLLGTDSLGRDILSRMILGTRVSLVVALAAIILGGGIGTVLGLLAGYCGQWSDSLIMRACDAMLALPMILLALLLAVVLGPSLQNLVIIIGLTLWARFARQVRGEVLSLKPRDFVALARIAGASPIRIMMHHIFPNLVNTVVVLATLQVGYVILMEASLSFLGAGIPPPTPAWGSMISEGRGYIATAWWISVFPGAAVLLVVLALNLFGDWLRDTLDPKLRQI